MVVSQGGQDYFQVQTVRLKSVTAQQKLGEKIEIKSKSQLSLKCHY